MTNGCFCYVRFSFLRTSQEIGWEERVRTYVVFIYLFIIKIVHGVHDRQKKNRQATKMEKETKIK